MALFDDEPSAGRASPHVVGADLSTLSVEELKGIMILLQDEIARIEREISAKIAIISAADIIFKD